MTPLAQLQKRLDELVSSEGLNPDRGDCLDLAVATCLSAARLGFAPSVRYIERFHNGESVALVHAVCYVDDEPVGSAASYMNDLDEHLEFLGEDDAYSLRLAYERDDEHEIEEIEARNYEIGDVSSQDLVNKDVSLAFAEFSERRKNNRDEPLLDVTRITRYVSCLLGKPQPGLKKSPARSSTPGF